MALAAGSLEEWGNEATPVITSLLDVGGLGDRLAGPRVSSVRSVGNRVRMSMAAAVLWLDEHPCPDPSIGDALVESIDRYRDAADDCLRDARSVDPTALEDAGRRFVDVLNDVLARLRTGAPSP